MSSNTSIHNMTIHDGKFHERALNLWKKAPKRFCVGVEKEVTQHALNQSSAITAALPLSLVIGGTKTMDSQHLKHYQDG